MRETSIFKTDLGPSLDLITLATIFFVGINSLQLGAQQLPDSAISIDSLTVTVLRGSDAINQTPYAISIRDQAELQLGNTGLSLEEALQGLPGVQVQNRYNYAVGERISIRGFGARAGFGVRGIKIIVDGIPATMADGQSTLDHVDIGSLGRAEVLRGPRAVGLPHLDEEALVRGVRGRARRAHGQGRAAEQRVEDVPDAVAGAGRHAGKIPLDGKMKNVIGR